jgi:primosomal protein N' (replication factor Y) (superfamily II helicase)
VPLVRAWALDRSFRYSIPDELRGQIAIGSLVRVPLGRRKVRGIVVEVGEVEDSALEKIRTLVVPVPLAPPPIRDLLRWVASRYVAPQPAAFERVVPPRVRIKPPVHEPLRGGPRPQLLLAYARGAELGGAIANGGSGVWCLRSLSGENRARLIAELVGCAARASGVAVVTVPEVRYGSVVLGGLQEEFPDCARLDSAQDDGTRAAGWLAMAAGNGLGAGGRGAVFVPAPELRLLVVDEEHHRTYKEDRSPRFDARSVAIERARLQGSICVLISVAPSLETGAAVVSGAFRIAEPSRAADRAARPIVELMEKPRDRQLAHELHRRIHDRLRAGDKVGVLVPQRGYARALWCGACHRSVRCPVCEAGLRLDSAGETVRCPRCGFSGVTPSRCPTCKEQDFHMVGAGSERIAEQLGSMFPRARVHRVDPDTLLEAGPQPARDADIYVTTWIGTKPALRPDVSLVAVLDADALIRMPDFRAAENAHRALVEMAEWAGPASSGGRLVLQTSEPSHHSIQAVVRADYRFFLERELAHRRELLYPPFSELVKVRASGEGYARLLGEVADGCKTLGAKVLGPIEVGSGGRPSSRPAAEVLVKHRDAQIIAEYLRVILPKVPASTRLRVDVDPR